MSVDAFWLTLSAFFGKISSDQENLYHAYPHRRGQLSQHQTIDL